jgi:oligo-1,6-glucosidase
MHYKESVIYQIYPRSFCDANGDGIGDLQGIISKLDYLQTLGIDIIWLSPIFQSPNADNGYDISDYQAIMPEFGTMSDFDALLKGVHERGMQLILDLVVNHSSDEHKWFMESRKSKESPYRQYYIWQPGKNGSEPNNWISFFSGPAWEFDEATREYYLHLFARKQPDLNWENPALRQEIYRMMRFWLDKGVDGFRMDVIPFLSKDQTFANYPEGHYGDLSLYANGPRIHEFLQEMNRETLSQYNCLSIGEGFGVRAEQANLYVGRNRGELDMIYHFDHAVPRDEFRFVDPAPEFTLPELKAIFSRWNEAIANDGWQNIYFGNHDNPRILSRFGDPEHFHYASATMLATVLLTQRGTPNIYQGDEIGMTNCFFKHIEEYDDIQVKNAYKTLVEKEQRPETLFLQTANRIARDHARTPMQWSDAKNGGFSININNPTGESKTKPWLKVNPDYSTINVARQDTDSGSVLNYYRKLLQWRKQTPAIHHGTYQDLLPFHPVLWVFERILESKRFVILANFSADEVAISEVTAGYIIVSSNYTEPLADTLQPYEARICCN